MAVLPGGRSGFQYGLTVEDTPDDEDEILDLSDGIRVFVDPFRVQYLEGVEIYYVGNMRGAALAFQNPAATGSCGCGSSFAV